MGVSAPAFALMAVIYLTHPVHGAKVATLDIEAEADIQNGWSRYNPEEVEPVVSHEPKLALVNKLVPVVEKPEEVVELAPVVRRGRPKLAR